MNVGKILLRLCMPAGSGCLLPEGHLNPEYLHGELRTAH